MEPTFEEEPQQNTFPGTTGAPATKEAPANSFFNDDDDDGFGDFEDAALPLKTESAPPAAPAAVPTTAAGNKKDILNLNPAAFLDAATTTMARFSPLHKGTGTDKHDKSSNNSGINTLKELLNKFPQLRQSVTPSRSSSSFRWEGSTSQARLLHRLNLGPAPVVSSPLLTQPPITRAANVRPSSSSSLYGSTASFPAPPAKQHRSVLAPPPPPPPPPPPQQQTKNTEAVLEKDIDPAKADPFASSGSADLVDLIQPAEVPRDPAQPRTNGLGELTLLEPAQGLVQPLAIAVEEQQREEEEDKEEMQLDKEEMQLDNRKENADSTLLFAAKPPQGAPYQNPFMEENPPREEENCDVALVAEEQLDTQEVDPYNPVLVAGEENKDLEENDHRGPHAEMPTGVVEEEIKEEVKGMEVENKVETVEDEDSFDAFEEAPPAMAAAAAVAAAAVAVINSNDDTGTILKGAEEGTKEETTGFIGERQHNEQTVVEEEVLVEEAAKIGKVNGKESQEDFDEFEWAEADSHSVHTNCSTEVVEDIDVSLGTHPLAATPVVVEVVEEREQEPVVSGAAPENGEVMNAKEEHEGNDGVDSIIEKTIEEEEDDFDDFCEADEAPVVGQEEEKKAVVVPTATEVAEELAATLPDLSFMLSDSLIKASP